MVDKKAEAREKRIDKLRHKQAKELAEAQADGIDVVSYHQLRMIKRFNNPKLFVEKNKKDKLKAAQVKI